MAREVTAVDAPIVVAVDGTDGDGALVPVALGWAARLGRRLDVVTVAEPPAPDARRGRNRPEATAERCTSTRWRPGQRRRGRGRVPRDSAPPACDGLIPFLNRTAALVVLGSRHRPGLGRLVLGGPRSTSCTTAVPAVVVPMPPRATADPVPGRW